MENYEIYLPLSWWSKIKFDLIYVIVFLSNFSLEELQLSKYTFDHHFIESRFMHLMIHLDVWSENYLFN